VLRTLLVAQNLPGSGRHLPRHPHHLDGGTAGWWHGMHIILAVIFPLLGAAQWVLLDNALVVLRLPDRAAAFGYAGSSTARWTRSRVSVAAR
jgi:hypothetical protein